MNRLSSISILTRTARAVVTVCHHCSKCHDPLIVPANLYEEGKVCLSILGTWSGDASESWE